MKSKIEELEEQLNLLKRQAAIIEEVNGKPEPSVKRSVGRPYGTYKVPGIHVFTWRALNSKISRLKKLRIESIEELEKDILSILKIDHVLGEAENAMKKLKEARR